MYPNSILVLTKARYDYSSPAYTYGGYGQPVGLNNSAAFITDALTEVGYKITHKAVVDANSIDREVFISGATLVVLEALWVTPEKLRQLAGIYPHVQWVVRLHSNIPFLGMEGQAFAWSKQLATIPNVQIASNNEQTAEELAEVLQISVVFLPNIYLLPLYCPGKGSKRHTTFLDISCFGAIRPFKNHLLQATAAILAANELQRTLRFHINGSRVEQKGDTILQNLLALFEDSTHELVFHGWQKHEDFLYTVAKMDIGLQVSFTESFNIVAADHVHVGVPLVVSEDVHWLPDFAKAPTTKAEEIKQEILKNLKYSSHAASTNKIYLTDYNNKGYDAWNAFLTSISF